MIRKLALLSLLAATGFAAGIAFAQTALKTGRTPQFENGEVKVWKSLILPHDPLPFHRHEHPRVLIALTTGNVDIVEKTGPVEHHPWTAGHAYWLPANAPGTEHQDVNVGDKPIEVIVVELQNAH